MIGRRQEEAFFGDGNGRFTGLGSAVLQPSPLASVPGVVDGNRGRRHLQEQHPAADGSTGCHLEAVSVAVGGVWARERREQFGIDRLGVKNNVANAKATLLPGEMELGVRRPELPDQTLRRDREDPPFGGNVVGQT